MGTGIYEAAGLNFGAPRAGVPARNAVAPSGRVIDMAISDDAIIPYLMYKR